MTDETTKEFERDWAQIKQTVGTGTQKEDAEIIWLRGRLAGMHAAMRAMSLPEKPVDAIVSETAARAF